MSIQSYTLDSGSGSRIVNHVTFSVGDVFINLNPSKLPTGSLGISNVDTSGTTQVASIAGAMGQSLTPFQSNPSSDVLGLPSATASAQASIDPFLQS
jgi:hypothetical protein